MLSKLATEELPGTAVDVRKKGRAGEGAEGAEDGDEDASGGGTWERIGAVAGRVLERLRGSPGLTASMSGEPPGGTDTGFHQPDAHARRAGSPTHSERLMMSMPALIAPGAGDGVQSKRRRGGCLRLAAMGNG